MTKAMRLTSAVLSIGITLQGPLAFSASCDPNILKISAVGDVLIHEALYKSILKDPNRFYSLWSPMQTAFEAADISYANLEGPTAMGVTSGGSAVGDVGFNYDCRVYCGTNFMFNYHPTIIKDLQRVGIDIVSVANNHALDRKSLGLDRTIEALRSAKMNHSGVKHSQDQTRVFHTVTSAKGFNIAWLSCAEHTNGMPDNRNQVLKCYSQELLTNITQLSRTSGIDAVIVTPHWGQEYVHQPATAQKQWAKAYADAGATAIVGNHPHVLQSFEWIVSKDKRRVPVAYSLGNFVSGQGAVAKNTTAVLYLNIERVNGRDVQVSSVEALPAFRELRGSYSNGGKFQVKPIDQIKDAPSEAMTIVKQVLKGVPLIRSGQLQVCQ